LQPLADLPNFVLMTQSEHSGTKELEVAVSREEHHKAKQKLTVI
jgi:hypothetical protein